MNIYIEDRHHFEGKSKVLEFVDAVPLYFVRKGFGKDISHLIDPHKGFISDVQMRTQNAFARFICQVIACTILLPVTLLGLAIKWCMLSEQDRALNELMQKHAPKNLGASAKPASQPAAHKPQKPSIAPNVVPIPQKPPIVVPTAKSVAQGVQPIAQPEPLPIHKPEPKET